MAGRCVLDHVTKLFSDFVEAVIPVCFVQDASRETEVFEMDVTEQVEG